MWFWTQNGSLIGSNSSTETVLFMNLIYFFYFSFCYLNFSFCYLNFFLFFFLLFKFLFVLIIMRENTPPMRRPMKVLSVPRSSTIHHALISNPLCRAITIYLRYLIWEHTIKAHPQRTHIGMTQNV
jgi:hypothetical protein